MPKGFVQDSMNSLTWTECKCYSNFLKKIMSGFHAKSPDLLENMILCEGDQVYIAMLIGCVVSMQNYVNYASCLP